MNRQDNSYASRAQINQSLCNNDQLLSHPPNALAQVNSSNYNDVDQKQVSFVEFDSKFDYNDDLGHEYELPIEAESYEYVVHESFDGTNKRPFTTKYLIDPALLQSTTSKLPKPLKRCKSSVEELSITALSSIDELASASNVTLGEYIEELIEILEDGTQQVTLCT
jgi:hypothetical protein